MLDPWIIEEIRRREEREKLHQDRRPILEIPIETPRSDDRDRDKRPPDDDRGVVIINYGM